MTHTNSNQYFRICHNNRWSLDYCKGIFCYCGALFTESLDL